MNSAVWKGCPAVSFDDEVVHGEPVFSGTRLPVETAIENYYAYRDMEGLPDGEAIEQTLKSFPTIPSADALRTVLAFEACHEQLLTS